MTELVSARDLFKGRHFDQEIIVLCVRWYLTFKLSSRDLVQMMAERGIAVAHTTILRWVLRYVPEFEKRWNRYARPGFPRGPTLLPYPLVSTPANDAWARNNAWAAYNANLRHIPTAENPNRLAARQNLLDQHRFIQMPQSSRRYNFQFSDNEIRSVQASLRRLGIYAGQVDGILGPDTRRAIEDYQVKHKLPVTGQPDQGLNALLGIF